MKGRSLMQYLLIIILNVFLFIPVILFYGIIAPIHLLIFYLSFVTLLKGKKFQSTLSTYLFSVFPSLVLLTVFFIWFITASDQGIIESIADAPILPLLVLFTSVLEFNILFWIYSTYRKRKAINE
jgi:hypothetical protein